MEHNPIYSMYGVYIYTPTFTPVNYPNVGKSTIIYWEYIYIPGKPFGTIFSPMILEAIILADGNYENPWY